MFGMFGRRQADQRRAQADPKNDPRSVMSFARNAQVVDSYIAPNPNQPARKQKRRGKKEDPQSVIRDGGNSSLTAIGDLSAPVFCTQQMIDLYDIASWGFTVPTPNAEKTLVTVSAVYTTTNSASGTGFNWNGILRLVIGYPMIIGANQTLFASGRKVNKLFVSASPIVLSVNSTDATAEEQASGLKPIASTVYATNTTTMLVGEEMQREIAKTFTEKNTETNAEQYSNAFNNAITLGSGTEVYTTSDAFIEQAWEDPSQQYTGTYASQYSGARCEPITEAMYYSSGLLTKVLNYEGSGLGTLSDNAAITSTSNGCFAIVLINLSEDLIAKHYLDLGIDSQGIAKVNKSVLNMSVSVTVTAELEDEN